MIENDLKGEENWFELARGSSYRESTVVLIGAEIG